MAGEWSEAGRERVLLQPPLKMAAARSGRHFLVSFFSLSSAQDGGSGRWPLLLPAVGLPRALSKGVEELGSRRQARRGS